MDASEFGKDRSAKGSERRLISLRERISAAGRAHGLEMVPAAFLLLATLAVYHPAWHGGALWDDDSHITRAELRSLHGLWRIWFEPGATQQYYPLTHSAFWIMYKLWAGDTLGYHLVSIFLHALSALFVAMILRRLAVPGAWLAAALFALHPIQVESVAWISELKNTLSGVFYLGAAIAYLRFDESRRRCHFAVALVVFVMALLSKSITATLPAVLLSVFWWRRGELRWSRDVLPLTPFLLLGAAAGMLTTWVERTLIGARGAEFQFTWVERILIAGRAVWFYIGKLLWPVDLIFIYPRWQIDARVWWQYVFPVCLGALCVSAWLFRRRSRSPLAVVLLFCATLFPALGFVSIFPFRFSFVADHFQYLAGIPVFAAIGGAWSSLGMRADVRTRTATIAGLVILGGPLALMTWNQSRQYADAEILYRATILRNPSCWLAYGNLGALELNGRVKDAVVHFREAVRLKPDFAENHYNLGNALQKDGNLAGAVAEYREALRLEPDFAQAHSNMGNALQKMGRLDEAMLEYKEALRLMPDLAEAHNNLGFVLRRLGRFADALREWRVALKIDPDFFDAHYNLAVTLQAFGQFNEAISEYREALRLRPDFAYAHNNLGMALQRTGRVKDAAAEYKEALRLRPDLDSARANLNSILAASGTIKLP